MPWTKPDFVEISLGMEVTAYVNTDDGDTLLDRQARGEEAAAGTSGETAA